MVVIAQSGHTSLEAFDTYLKGLEALRQRGQRFVIVLDLRAGEPFTFAQRTRQNKWIADHPEHLTRLMGIAFLESSWMMRGAMKASFFALPPTYPFMVTGSQDEAYAWAQARATADNVQAGVGV